MIKKINILFSVLFINNMLAVEPEPSSELILWQKPVEVFISDPTHPTRAHNIYEMMQAIHDAFEKYSVKYSAICGTVLGAVRHGGFIPWDNDIDLIAYEGHLEGINEALSILKENGYTIKTYPDVMKITIVNADGFEAELNVKPDDDTGYTLDKNLFFPTKKCFFGKTKINIPNQWEILLFRWYGDTWSTKIKKIDGTIQDIMSSDILPLGPFEPINKIQLQLRYTTPYCEQIDNNAHLIFLEGMGAEFYGRNLKGMASGEIRLKRDISSKYSLSLFGNLSSKSISLYVDGLKIEDLTYERDLQKLSFRFLITQSKTLFSLISEKNQNDDPDWLETYFISCIRLTKI